MNRKISSWAGKHVWIIGASSGIGAACATLLLEQGACVALSARHRASLELLCQGQPLAQALPLDITEPAQLQGVCAQLQQQWAHIDLILVVAGGYQSMRADNFDLDAAQGLLALNVGGVFNCLAQALPWLLRQGSGGIGIVASVAGYGGLPKALAYGASKAALINLTESLYLDLHGRGIDVYQINPGFVATPLTARNDFKMPALMTAHDAAVAMLDGIERGQFHIHFPKRFTNMLRLARLLPYRAYFWLIRKVTGL
ncbi:MULTISPECIES: SDR family NAD(P)-dependent oxidoreductase [unclassified Janthinobacterium]|uniref:SDR family NAD(P)-dependent oxidoreductase n=1 Tax=unclassified Janthinobacterium TaxID=2610881 RepID=UPI00028A1CBB|nr:SDR family NAD(P)-dependent oxidoreductase [Janthinobacterium sp. CG_23.4]MCL6483829.1 SDR family NAD(P)-dependent oxidoreductase [Janthinobacterium lividum]MDH6156466.1 NAD(P)-dependent dehydrogenase (short-subunit alcohol dehydrogenase family) [Janthinobacterium sp. CG_23.4]